MADPVRLLLTSDVHLDAAFGWAGEFAATVREDIRQTVERIIELAQLRSVDVVCCAGDMFEDARVMPDTGRFLQAMFAKLAPIPVLIAPGNHDPWHERSPYRQIEWPSNVHIFTEESLVPHSVAGLAVWGGAHLRVSGTATFLDQAIEGGPDPNIALFHGSEMGSFPAHDKVAHAPFQRDDVRRCGLLHALVGHYHDASGSPWHTYAGTPQRLSFSQREPGTVAIIQVSVDGAQVVSREVVEQLPFVEERVDITGVDTVSDVRSRLRDAAGDGGGALRLVIEGTVERDLGLRGSSLVAHLNRRHPTDVRVGTMYRTYDTNVISKGMDVRGAFVRNVVALGLEPDLERRVTITGLRALDGIDNLEVT